jgi:hypothetical protein
MEESLTHRFTYHPPFGDQTERYERIRAAALEFALLLHELTPLSAERAQAINRLDECVMWANASIARNEFNEPA